MKTTEIIDRLSAFFKGRGYKRICTDFRIASVKWAFHLVVENKEETIAIEYRKTDTISDVFLDRIETIRGHGKRLLIYIVFERLPRTSIMRLLYKYQVGVIVIHRTKISFIKKSKNFSRKKIHKKEEKKRKARKKRRYRHMHQIYVFISSKQYEKDVKRRLPERSLMENIVRKIDREHSVPISPCLIEEVFEDDIRFKCKITKKMKICHIFICALTEEYGELVEYEIRKAFEIFRNKKNFMLLLKKEILPNEFDGRQLKLIKYVQKSKQYISYSSKKRFREIINDYLLKCIGTLYNRNRSKSPFSFD